MAVEEQPGGGGGGKAMGPARAGGRLRPATPSGGPAPALPAVPRGHLELAAENDGLTPWCGPAAVALATGRSYAEACDMLRGVAPAWYPAAGPIVTAYWRDLLAVLREAGVPHDPLSLPDPHPTLLALVRRGDLDEGWYLLRVTDHFLLLRSHGFGLATLHDNRHTGAVVTGRTHGRRKLTHAARLLGGPLVAAGRAPRPICPNAAPLGATVPAGGHPGRRRSPRPPRAAGGGSPPPSGSPAPSPPG